MVRLLLANGAAAESPDRTSSTPLLWAARAGHTDIAALLLRAGARVDTLGGDGCNALLLAARAGHTDMVSLLVEQVQPGTALPFLNTVDRNGQSSLALACKEGNLETAFKLLAAGAQVNLLDRVGDTAIIHASKAGHANIVELLLNKQAELDIRGKEGKTALLAAVEKNQGGNCLPYDFISVKYVRKDF